MQPSDVYKQKELTGQCEESPVQRAKHKNEAKSQASQKLVVCLLVLILCAAVSYLFGYYTAFTCFLGLGTLTFVWFGLDLIRQPASSIGTVSPPTGGEDGRAVSDCKPDTKDKRGDEAAGDEVKIDCEEQPGKLVNYTISKSEGNNEDEKEKEVGNKDPLRLSVKERNLKERSHVKTEEESGRVVGDEVVKPVDNEGIDDEEEMSAEKKSQTVDLEPSADKKEEAVEEETGDAVVTSSYSDFHDEKYDNEACNTDVIKKDKPVDSHTKVEALKPEVSDEVEQHMGKILTEANNPVTSEKDEEKKYETNRIHPPAAVQKDEVAEEGVKSEVLKNEEVKKVEFPADFEGVSTCGKIEKIVEKTDEGDEISNTKEREEETKDEINRNHSLAVAEKEEMEEKVLNNEDVKEVEFPADFERVSTCGELEKRAEKTVEDDEISSSKEGLSKERVEDKDDARPSDVKTEEESGKVIGVEVNKPVDDEEIDDEEIDDEEIDDEEEMSAEETSHTVDLEPLADNEDEVGEEETCDEVVHSSYSDYHANQIVDDEDIQMLLSKKDQLEEEKPQRGKYFGKSEPNAIEDVQSEDGIFLEDKTESSAEEAIGDLRSPSNTDIPSGEIVDGLDISSSTDIPSGEIVDGLDISSKSETRVGQTVQYDGCNEFNDREENKIEENTEVMDTPIKADQSSEEDAKPFGVETMQEVEENFEGADSGSGNNHDGSDDLDDREENEIEENTEVMDTPIKDEQSEDEDATPFGVETKQEVEENFEGAASEGDNDQKEEDIFKHGNSVQSVSVSEKDKSAVEIMESENTKGLRDKEKTPTDETTEGVLFFNEREHQMIETVQLQDDKMDHGIEECIRIESECIQPTKKPLSTTLGNLGHVEILEPVEVFDEHQSEEGHEMSKEVEVTASSASTNEMDEDEIDGIPLPAFTPRVGENEKDELDAFGGLKKPKLEPAVSELSKRPSEPIPTAPNRWKPTGAVSMFGGLDPAAVLGQLKPITNRGQGEIKKEHISTAAAPIHASSVFSGDKEKKDGGLFGDLDSRIPPPTALKPSTKFTAKKLPTFNPAAMLPGATHPRLGKMLKERSVDFDEPAETDTLTSAAKDRPRLNRRRPSSRKVRLESARNSSLSFEDFDETDHPDVAGRTY